jgi:hypothetical protein
MARNSRKAYTTLEIPTGRYLASGNNVARFKERIAEVNAANNELYKARTEEHTKIVELLSDFYGAAHPLTDKAKRSKPAKPPQYSPHEVDRRVRLFERQQERIAEAEQKKAEKRERANLNYQRRKEAAIAALIANGFVENVDFTRSNAERKAKELLIKIGPDYVRRVPSDE